MTFYIFKILFTVILIFIITEISKISGKLGGIITAMPLTTLLVIFWLYYEKVPNSEISDYVKNTLYFILPTIPMFVIFPFLIARFGFFISISLSIFSVAIFVIITNFLLKYFNV
ncbi:MAG: hypothetical protein CFH34_01111 [Alphaproteobacteria bacterium MarineAlpha9_Bin4]|nr:hypothetical protein [Pelagibacterales bacterium]PPR26162.1 MAG: hypothetical protein CFH34_01111 [Alphaproteobacteria bacterium MarineAlpha9_Bin4]|tara:strand:+ start:1184 stop:1525 length:342 start_codon:yes stop_codon:yes gene_type:complete